MFAASLAAGSGALYHHFTSKEALLDAGIDRQLDRRRAMRDIRSLFAGLGDLQAELTVLGRYLFGVIDEELLQIAARTPAGRSSRLDTAYAALIDGLHVELGDWIAAWVPAMAAEERDVVTAIAINALLGSRSATSLFHQSVSRIPDDRYRVEYATFLANRIREPR
nr:TetR family transcriptional regulator [Mycolicibacterium sarraceniae]